MDNDVDLDAFLSESSSINSEDYWFEKLNSVNSKSNSEQKAQQ